MEILVDGQLDYFEEKSWKKRYFVMKYEITSALRYIEIYKDKNWQKQLPRHVVNLHPGYEVRRKEDPKKKHCFSVKTTDHTLILASEDENVITRWMATLEEYNLVKSFCVQPQDTATMVRIEAVFPCHLQLVHSEVRLVSAMDGKLLGLWPFKCIRRYKFVGNSFSIEAGRKAPTGEGIFEFISNECSEIYRVMDTIIRTKAGNTTMRRLASEKLHNQVEQVQKHPVRKTNSVPVAPKAQIHYDYADPLSTVSRASPPPGPLPPPPPLPEIPKADPTYDMLSPGLEGTANDFNTAFCKQNETAANENSYNTLQFANSRPKETVATGPHRTPTMAGSPGSYDTLRFSASLDSTSNEHEVRKTGEYDTLQFGTRDDVQVTKNRLSDNDLPHSSGSFYDTLDHASLSQSPGSIAPGNTYDILNVGGRPLSGEADTYDCLGNTGHEVKPPTTLDLGNTYDALHHESQKPTGKSSPVQAVTPMGKPTAPTRPPPRIKSSAVAKHPEAPPRMLSAGSTKLEKPTKVVRRNAPSPTKEDQKPSSKPERISDVIQKRLAMPAQPVDDGNYASVDHDSHEYSSVDYSKVLSRNDSTDSSSDIYTDPDYADPDEADARGSAPSAANKSSNKPTKPARHPPRAMKNIFKKAPPKPKPDAEGGGKFADELKKKLEIKLKKSGGHKAAAASEASQSAPSEPENDDSIYDEVAV